MNVRELIGELLKQDLDNEATLSLLGTDPVEINSVEDDSDGNVIISYDKNR